MWLWGSVDFRVLAMQSRSLQSQCTCRSSESPLRNASPPALEGTFPETSPKPKYSKNTHKRHIQYRFNTQHYTSKSQLISKSQTWNGRNNLFKTWLWTNTTFNNIHQALPQKGWCNRCSPHLLGLALEMPRPCTTRLPPETRSRGHRSCRDWWLHRFEWPTNFCSNTPLARQTLVSYLFIFLKVSFFFLSLDFFSLIGVRWKNGNNIQIIKSSENS